MKYKTNSGENVFVFRSIISPEKLKDISHATLGSKQTDTSSSGDGLIEVRKSCNIIIMVVTLECICFSFFHLTVTLHTDFFHLTLECLTHFCKVLSGGGL